MSFNYTSLKNAVAEYMARDDLDPRLDEFIELCESELNTVLGTRHQITEDELTLDANGQVALPADYLEFRYVTALTNPRRRLAQVAPDWLDSNYPTRASGYPSVFTIDGSTLTVIPITSSDISFNYFAKIPALTSAAQTNWLTSKMPNLYLYGALKQAAVFTKDASAAQVYGGLYGELIGVLMRDERSASWSRGSARVAGATP